MHQQVILLANQILQIGEVGNLGAELLAVQVFANLHALLQQRHRGLELGDTGSDGVALGDFLRLLLVDRGELGIALRNLADKILAGSFDESRIDAGGGLKSSIGLACIELSARRRATSSSANSKSLLT